MKLSMIMNNKKTHLDYQPIGLEGFQIFDIFHKEIFCILLYTSRMGCIIQPNTTYTTDYL